VRVDQILCAAGPVDAVTNHVLAWRRQFACWGWTGSDHAPVTAAGMPAGAVVPLRELHPGQADRVVLHYSGYAPGLAELVSRCPGTLLVSHNVTPPRYFWTHDPAEAVRCQLAADQLGELCAVAGSLAGVSEYNAAALRELSGRDARVIPILFERSTLPPRGDPPGGSPAVLFVGRLAPTSARIS
jgi:hypothetical protein